MNLATVWVMALLAGGSWKLEAESLTVCTGNIPQMTARALAQSQAGKMFATAGVKVDWRPLASCPANEIQVRFSENSMPADHPGAFAYALPYEGTTIVIFYDRLQKCSPCGGSPGGLAAVLAHVMVHEITHVLQGVARHSDTGVMKARFTLEDQRLMPLVPLPFTKQDVTLIQYGLIRREARLLAAK